MKRLSVELAASEAKILLECLMERERRLALICETSDDPDEIADAGNDLVELRLLLKALSKNAVESFGDSVLNFSREPL